MKTSVFSHVPSDFKIIQRNCDRPNNKAGLLTKEYKKYTQTMGTTGQKAWIKQN